MYVHNFLKNGNSDIENENYGEMGYHRGFLHKLLSYFTPNSSDNFFYNISGYSFTLEELKHALLRGNKRPTTSFFRLLNDTDERTQILDKLSDPRILFVCLDKGQIPESIEVFDDPDTLDDKFDELLIGYFNEKVEIDTTNEEITLPTVFQDYRDDFGGSDEKVLRFIWDWYENNEYELEDIIKLVNKKSLMIKYDDQM